MQVITPKQLGRLLLNVALTRPVFVWGPPGIGKSALVEQFAHDVGLDCVSLLGSQLAPEDLIGVPQIVDGRSVFCPPRMIARDAPYLLFVDELNACSFEVQKAFYSLINDRRLGEYTLPSGSIVVGAGNRAQDQAIVKPMSSALMNRMLHVELKPTARDWLDWAYANGAHEWVIGYIETRPDHLSVPPPKVEETFSTPRAWHILSDALRSYGAEITPAEVEMLAAGVLSANHARSFAAFVKQLQGTLRVELILSGDQPSPAPPKTGTCCISSSSPSAPSLPKLCPRSARTSNPPTSIWSARPSASWWNCATSPPKWQLSWSPKKPATPPAPSPTGSSSKSSVTSPASPSASP